MQVDIDARLDRWQSELLDLTRRNRMLNYRLTSRSTLSIVEPGFDALYAQLTAEGAALSFQRPLDRMTDARVYSLLALMEALGTPLPVVVGDIKTEGAMLERQRTLANLRQKARLALEEQGANILFLSLGFLKWRDGEGAQGVDRYAPLVLMPVNITQATVGAPLMLERRDEEVIANPTLEYFLRSAYGIQLPAFDSDAPTLDEYLNGVSALVSGRGWRVVRAASLGLLSFLKLSMYQDMERNRAAMLVHPVIRAIAGDRSALRPGADVARDFHDAQDPADSCQVVSADSSQQDAIELSRRGESFIMQGPPGTGKSQTITNMIAQALADGRRVLFVAEKMAALQVVYRKLQDAGLSDFCLPIHSHKANKREVLGELRRTLELDRPQVRDEARAQLEQLRRTRDALNAYARQLHSPMGALGMSVYEACGELAKLRSRAEQAAALPAAGQCAAPELPGDAMRADGGALPALSTGDISCDISDNDSYHADGDATITPDDTQRIRSQTETEYQAPEPWTGALFERVARVSFPVDDAARLDAAALARRCELARAYGAARACCPTDNPFEGVSVAGGLARRGELLAAMETARDGVRGLAALMPGLRARGVERAALSGLDELRAALQAASSARMLPPKWLDEPNGDRLRALLAGLQADARRLEQGVADMRSVCSERVLDADFDAICGLLDVLARVDGALPRSAEQLRDGVERLRMLAGEARMGVAGLLAQARAYCALTGVAGDTSLSAADAHRAGFELLRACVGLPEGCVLAEPASLAELCAPLAERLAQWSRLRALLSGAGVDIADWDAQKRADVLGSARDLVQGVRAAGLDATPAGIERWADAAEAARARYGLLCDAVKAAAHDARVEGGSLDAALRACELLDMLGEVPAAWADAGARAQLQGELGGLRARAQELALERAALEARFTARAFAPETARLLARFNAVRGSVLRMFRPAYHADRQQVRECFRDAELSDEDMARQLGEAVEHASRAGELSAELWSRAPLLGRHLAADGSVAWERLAAELSAFGELSGLLGAREALLAADQPGRAQVAALRQAIMELRRGVDELGRLGVRIDLDAGAASGLDACTRAAAQGRELARQVREVCAALGAPDATYETACEYARAARELSALEGELRRPGDDWRKLLGADVPRAPEGWAMLERGIAALCGLARAQGGRLTMRTRELLLSPARDRLIADAVRDARAWASARTGGAQSLKERDVSAARLCEDAARLLGRAVDGMAPDELCAALEALTVGAAQGMAGFDAACGALEPGVPERRIVDYARDFAELRALKRRLGMDGEAADALGELWRGADTNWKYVYDCVTLLEQVRAARERLSGSRALIDGAFGRGPADALCDEAIMALSGAQRARTALTDAQAGAGLLQLEPDALAARLERCLARPELLAAQAALDAARQDCAQAGMTGFTRALDAAFEERPDGAPEMDARLSGAVREALAAAAGDAYRRAALECWLDWAVSEQPALREFTAAAQSARVDEFDRLDDVQLKIARARLRQRLCAELPESGHMVRGGDEYAVLMRELGKRQRHMPLRRLFGAIPNLLMRLKPCLMMSPLSVAYFLEAETYRFDLVIFDEASQIQPQDALGAIVRGAQVVIAGDPLQLPPTRFFAAALDDESDAEGDDEPLYDSILEGAGTALRRCMLRWHYRSRHEHLIAFSNARIYDGGLITFPGAREHQRDMGVEYVYVENGVYEGQGINQTEARRCVQLVQRHILTHPERSLGVIAFSQKQQAAIEYAMEQFRLSHPELEWFFGESDESGARRDEPFFIKNLENVQGDERDTIIFSIGYGRNRQGRMYMRFGPLSGAGGERRLNVAITRAKLNVKLVGSILPEDMDLSRTASAGARMLRGYMEFALRGAAALGVADAPDGWRDEFCDHVAAMLSRAGYIVERRVGCSQYRVDIALRRPEAQGAYFAGIECDGPMYAAARTARERDHLRARVLEGMGWQLLRVWSREFLSDPEGQLRRILGFAAAAYAAYTEEPAVPEPELEPEQDWLTSPAPAPGPGAEQLRYGMAEYVAADWHDAPGAGGHGADLETCVKYIISVEQPIHIELLQRRLAGYFGNEKVTANSRRAVDEVMARLNGREVERTPEDFVYLKPRPPIRARTPAPDDAPRRIEHIAPEEIEQCMCGIIAGTFGITPEALMSEAVRALGYDRAGARITAALNGAYLRILSSGRAGLLDGKLKLAGGQ